MITQTHPKKSAIQTLQNTPKKLVIKYGGNAMTDSILQQAFAQDIALLHACGFEIIVVHGGGPQVDEMLQKIGHHSKRIDGMRVTDTTTMQIAEMVLGARVNGQLVDWINHFAHAGVAVGIHGKDAKTLIAQKLQSAVDLGLVGDIVCVQDKLLNTLLNNQFIPVIAPIATNHDSTITYNINADTAAGIIAKATHCEELILLTNIDGVLDEHKNLIATLTQTQINTLIQNGVIYGGMIPKLSGALDAIHAGIDKVTIINGCHPHKIIEHLLGNCAGTQIIKE